jgi:hypothetical protein
MKHQSKGAILLPIRVKSPLHVNAGYAVTVTKDSVKVYAAHIHSSMVYPDEYSVVIPRVQHDPRHWQLKKDIYIDTFRTFLRKVYTKSLQDQNLHFTTLTGRNPTTVQVNLMSFVNKLLDLLIANREFSVEFTKNRWCINVRNPDGTSDVQMTWYTNGPTANVGKGNKGNNCKVKREAVRLAATS